MLSRVLAEFPESVIERLSDGLLVADRSGRILGVNAALERMLGYTRAELKGLSFELLLPKRFRKEPIFENSAFQGPREVHALKKDGSEIPVEMTFSRVQSEEDFGFVAILRDNSQLQAFQSALVESEDRYRHIVESAADGIWILDSGMRIVYVNPRMASMLGYTSAEMLGRPAEDFIHESATDKLQALRLLCHRGVLKQAELRLRRKDSSDAWALVTMSPEISAGGDAGCLGIWTDITDRKLMEKQLAQAERLESIGRMSAGVAHDFNNLLTVINGYSDLAISRLKDDSPVFPQLQAIRRAGNDAQQLTRDLLALSRNPHAQTQTVDLNQLILEARAFLGRFLREDIELSVVTAAAPARIKADAAKLRQVIVNLCVNARDAMPAGGRLLIETSNQTLDQEQAARIADATEGEFVTLTVTDTGLGMDEETARHIFEPFFTTKGPGQGTGLGLSTVYGIVRQHQGFIGVRSTRRQGTEFKLHFPAAVEQHEAAAPARERSNGRGSSNKTVLVVEDHEQVRQILIASLQRAGYRTQEASSAASALEICRSLPEPPALVVTDLVMPEVSGNELAVEIRMRYPQTRVLCVSGNPEKFAEIEEPGIRFLAKPFTPDVLLGAVKGFLSTANLPRHVLVVDDDDAIREMFVEILGAAGFQTRGASNGKEAIRELRHAAADFVITDILMPEQEGIETIRQIKKECPAVRIIAVSGATDQTFLDAANWLGADAILPKPVSPRILLDTIQMIDDRARNLKPPPDR